MNRFFEKIEYKRLFLVDILVIGPILITIIVLLNTYGTDEMYKSFVFLIFSLFAYIIKLYLSKAYQTISITDTTMIIEKYFFKRIKRKEYLINDIENIKYAANENSDTSFSFVIFNIGGVPTMPESTKNHLKNPTVIHFNYKGESIKIGELTRKFNGESIVRIIKRIQKVNKKDPYAGKKS